MLSKKRLRLLAFARDAGDRLFDPRTGLCLIGRDTLWYATSLLFDDLPGRNDLGRKLIRAIRSEDGTHTPATMLAILHGVPDRIDPPTRTHLRSEIARELVHAAETQWRDGNVNHPLGAYCSLILGGELSAAPWAVDLGHRRLDEFQRLTGDRRFRIHRQAEMSEYNSLTYTALDILFLALIAEYAVSPESRELALFLEERLWLDEALHFHGPSQQFSGPHSRAYQDDSTGGFSALHTVLYAASSHDLFLEPNLCVWFHHPSSLLQSALTAIVPMHLPPEAERLAWEKPFPLLVQKTTYCEQYHENSKREVSGPAGEHRFAFDDEVYAGGLRELTTFMTSEYALGSASLPYVNAGHSDSVSLRIRRSTDISGMGDFRSAFTRGVFNGAQIGQRNPCHITGTEIDESYLYEEGRCATYQHRNRVIVFYTPKRAGHRGVTSFRLDLIFSYFAPFTNLVLEEKTVGEMPVTAPISSRLVFQDYQTYGVVIPLSLEPRSESAPVRLTKVNNHLVYSLLNYDGSVHDFSRDEFTKWHNGFVLELAAAGKFKDFKHFLDHARSLSVAESIDGCGTRRVRVTGPDGVMVSAYNPARECFVSRTWNGVEESVDHLRIEAGPAETSLIEPLTFFGSEAIRKAP